MNDSSNNQTFFGNYLTSQGSSTAENATLENNDFVLQLGIGTMSFQDKSFDDQARIIDKRRS